MKRNFVNYLVIVAALVLTACGSKSKPPAAPPVPAAAPPGLTAEQVKAALDELEKKVTKAKEVCVSTFGPVVQQAVQTFTPPGGTNYALVGPQAPIPQPATPSTTRQCFQSAEQAIYEFSHSMNGWYAASNGQAQTWMAQQAMSMLRGISGGQDINPNLAAAIGLPQYNNFINGLQNPGLAGPIQSAAQNLGLNNVTYNPGGATTSTGTGTSPVVVGGTGTTVQSGSSSTASNTNSGTGIDLSGLSQRGSLGFTRNTASTNRTTTDPEFRGITLVY